MTKDRPQKSKRSHFLVLAPGAHQVCVAGTFNGWNAESHPMQPHRNGDVAITSISS
jgi:1,4-alpha-glucan branching enzyme